MLFHFTDFLLDILYLLTIDENGIFDKGKGIGV